MTSTADITITGRRRRVVDLPAAASVDLDRLPHILRIMLENVLRNAGDDAPRARAAILNWLENGHSEDEIAFMPSRVLMHDTTCVPALVDIAGMRACARRGRRRSVAVSIPDCRSTCRSTIPWPSTSTARRDCACSQHGAGASGAMPSATAS